MDRASICKLLLVCLLVVMLWRPSQSFLQVVGLCDRRRGLTREMQTICRTHEQHMMYILDGARLGVQECQSAFSGHRWNCTFPRLKIEQFLHPILRQPTKEAAYVHAVVAAGTMHSISRACMESKLSNYCHCSPEKRPRSLAAEHTWGGCGDNLPYGYAFSRKFVDARENTKIETDTVTDRQKAELYDKYSRVLMNLHNNQAGRLALSKMSKIQCRCHGVSKNCATKFCYTQLADFKEVGSALYSQHRNAIKVKLYQQQSFQNEATEIKLVEQNYGDRKFTNEDLVFTADSPNYCARSSTYGIYGTKGRRCTFDLTEADNSRHRRYDSFGSATAAGMNKYEAMLRWRQNNAEMTAEDRQRRYNNHCNFLCCGKGHTTTRTMVREKCGCKFEWCCQVKCNMCMKAKNVHQCR